MLPGDAETFANVNAVSPSPLGSIATQKQVCAMHNPNEAPVTITVEIAHEFRELLTVALFCLEQLQRQSLNDRGREQLQRAQRAVGQIGEIINRVQPIPTLDAGAP
jgi:signal transduction histidine kinase